MSGTSYEWRRGSEGMPAILTRQGILLVMAYSRAVTVVACEAVKWSAVCCPWDGSSTLPLSLSLSSH